MKLIIKSIDEYYQITNKVFLHCSNKFNGYEIDCETTDDLNFRVILNIDNGFNNPRKQIDSYIKELKRLYNNPLYEQINLFDL